MKKDDIFFVIPARRDSKGLPFKNRKLLDYTLNEFPNDMREKVIVTTNDEEIIEKLSNTEFNVLEREEKLSDDKTRITDVIKHTLLWYQKRNINFSYACCDLFAYKIFDILRYFNPI